MTRTPCAPESPLRERRQTRRGQAAVLLCALCWSTSGLCIKLLPWHPLVIAGGRSAIGAIFLILVASRRTASAALPFTRPALPRTRLVWFTGALYCVTMITFVIANKLTTSANAIVLQYTAPVWAALFGWGLFRDTLRREQAVAMCAVFGGLGLFFKDSLGGGSLLGDGLALLSGICFGAHSVGMRRLKDGRPQDAMLASHILCAVSSLPFFVLAPPHLTPAAGAAIGFMGLVQIGCASLLFSYGIARISAVQTLLTAMIEPVLNPLWVLLVTGERPTATALAGGVVIVGAVAVSNIITTKALKAHKGDVS